jgi:hypothetical protein
MSSEVEIKKKVVVCLQEESDNTSREESSLDATANTSSSVDNLGGLGGSGSRRSRVSLGRLAGRRRNNRSALNGLGRSGRSRRLSSGVSLLGRLGLLRLLRLLGLLRLRRDGVGRVSLSRRLRNRLGLLGRLRLLGLLGLRRLLRVLRLGRLLRLFGVLRLHRLAGNRNGDRVCLLGRLRLGRSPGAVTRVRRLDNRVSLLGRNRDNMSLSHRADGGTNNDSLSGSVRLLRAVDDLRRALGNSGDLGGVDSRGGQVSCGVVLNRRSVNRLAGLGDISVDGHGLDVGGVLLGDGADGGADDDGLSSDMRLLGAVGDLGRALGDGVDTGGVDG